MDPAGTDRPRPLGAPQGRRLVALVVPRAREARGRSTGLVLLGLFGAALLYGDGMLTPAISVLSAVEGLRVVTPALSPYVIPATVVVLVALFSLQSRGSGGIGRLFAPVMIAWFATLAVLGTIGILHAPSVLDAVGPWHAWHFFAVNGPQGFAVLAAVFLVVTGGEALYADLGHFGRRPIRFRWFGRALVIGFGSSTHLAAAYGTAISANMVITTLLLCTVARVRWGWTWGALALGATLLPVDLFLPDLETWKLPRVPGSAVFLTGDARGTPHALLHNIKHNKVVHEQTLFLTLVTEDVPYVSSAERLSVKPLGEGFFRIVAHHGFMEIPNVPAPLEGIRSRGVPIDPDETRYFLGREKLIATGTSGMGRARELLFAFLSHDAYSATAYFRIPPNRVVEIGAQVEL